MAVTIEQVREWAGISNVSISDDALQQVINAETILQGLMCIVPADDSNPDLDQALLRRVARAVAAKGIPLGLIETEAGPTRLPVFDVEIVRYEQLHYQLVVA